MTTLVLNDDQRAVLDLEEQARSVAPLVDHEAQMHLSLALLALRRAVGLPPVFRGPVGARSPAALVVLPGGKDSEAPLMKEEREILGVLEQGIDGEVTL